MLGTVQKAKSKKQGYSHRAVCAKHSYEDGSPVGMQGLEDGGMLQWKADSDLQPQLDLQGEAPKTSMAVLKQDGGGVECWEDFEGC